MADPTVNPEVPFVGPLKDGFLEGQIVRIQGYTSHASERFNINFQTGPDSSTNDDIALHLSVRLLEGYVARNSLESGSWGDEQDEGDLPIGLGQKFEILVLSAKRDYKIAINGKHFCEFPQRISPKRISHLAITGDVKLALISYEGGDGLSKTSASVREGGMSGPNPTSPQEAYGSPMGQYGPPQGQYGPPQGQYGAPQGQYGPPQGGYGGYGPPHQGQGQYGPPQGGYGPPPLPGQQPGQESGFENFLETAGSVIAGAISSGMADKLIGSLTGGGNHQQGHQNPSHPQQNPPPTQQPQFSLPNFGGQGSVGGLGSFGSLLGSFAEQVLQPKKGDHH